mgnify:CR=1 FL=1
MISAEINHIIEQFNFEALMNVVEEQFGRDVMFKEMSMFHLWYSVQRKIIDENEYNMKHFLIRNEICSNERKAKMVINRYKRYKSVLPTLSERINQKLNHLHY